MTDPEYDIIDELYFVTSFPDLLTQLQLPEAVLVQHLRQLAGQGFVKCLFPDPDTECAFEEVAFEANYSRYYFLATKEGLLHHNSR